MRPSRRCWRSYSVPHPARFLLAFFKVGASFANRIEVTTAFNRIAGVREGIALVQHGLSPYTGSAFRGPPLLLPLLASTSGDPLLYCIPFIFGDLLSALLLRALVKDVNASRKNSSASSASPASGSQWDADTVMGLFLWNPLVLCTCIAGSSATFAVCAVLLALYSAVRGAPVMAAVGLAVASYLDLHHLLLMVPLSILLLTGVEDLNKEPTQANLEAASTPCTDPHTRNPSAPPPPPQPASQAVRGVLRVLLFWACFLLAAFALLLLSDLSLRAFLEHPCMGWLPHIPTVLRAIHQQLLLPLDVALDDSSPLGWVPHAAVQLQSYIDAFRQGWRLHGVQSTMVLAVVQQLLGVACGVHCYGRVMPPSIHTACGLDVCSGVEVLLKVEFQKTPQVPLASPHFQSSNQAKDWLTESYGGILVADDVTPNIGIWWYFVTEMFQEFKTFFKFVLHAQSLVFVLPMAIRLWHRPLFLVLMQLMLSALLKPYPTVSDVALYLTLFPLFMPQLRLFRGGVYIAVLLCLLAVLGPAMWHQWIYTGSANANFFYAITVAWGAAQVILMMMTLSATLSFDRLLAGKPLKYLFEPGSQKAA